MHTPEFQMPQAGRRRGRYSDEFKRQVIAACLEPGVSTAAIALANGLNANLARRWVAESAQRSETHRPRRLREAGLHTGRFYGGAAYSWQVGLCPMRNPHSSTGARSNQVFSNSGMSLNWKILQVNIAGRVLAREGCRWGSVAFCQGYFSEPILMPTCHQSFDLGAAVAAGVL